jgi:penicillin-binding protein activator
MRIPALISLVILGLTIVIISSGCGPKAFTKGEYDDPNRVELLDDNYNEADMQKMAETMIKSLVSTGLVVAASKPPILILERVSNRTQEHIDMVSLTDKIRTALIKSGKVRFVNKEERSTISDEYDYSESGNVNQKTAKKRGGQVGADYILSGNLATNVQEVGNDKFVYYKLTLNLTSIDSSTIDWTEESQIRKKFRKRSIGL